MKTYPKLSYQQLKKYCDLTRFKFDKTDEVPCLMGIMGQKTAEAAMEFGLEVEHPSYNIYISGAKGTGRTTYAKEVVEAAAKKKTIPQDWCYVYGLDEDAKIIALNMPAGMGKNFQVDMRELIKDVLTQVPQAFNSEDYDHQRNGILKKFQEQKNKLIQDLSAYANEKQFSVKSTSTGFTFTPLLEGEEASEEEMMALDDESQEELEVRMEEVHQRALSIVTKVKQLERLAKKKLLQLEIKVGLFVVRPLIGDFLDKYKDCEKVMDHIRRVEQDLIENIHRFMAEEDGEIVSISSEIEENDFFKRYMVNLFIDHSKTEGAPVILEFNPTLNNLTGKIEYENVNGNLRTNFLKIKPGAIQSANGGYLIVEARQLLTNPFAWETLKRILQTKEITIENMTSKLGVADGSSFKLEPIPINLKVIMIGSGMLHQLLYQHDDDFEKYFKILVDFQEEMDRSPEHEQQMVQFISCYTQREGTRALDKTGAARVIEYSSRLAGSQKKLSCRFNKVIEIIIEANQWANSNQHEIITERDVNLAIHEKWARLKKYQNKSEEMFKEGKILIDVKGVKVGVINGLSVINMGEYRFGKPSAITTTVSRGKGNIVNIEREANLSGDIYDKGVMILTGFLMERFAQGREFNLTARICFEQSYGGIDGDSASGAELFALLSNMANIPLKQSIAVTGSVNQKGFIQPVGGVTEKVEGFYHLCQKRGLTGNQGVVIPYQNIDDLMLSDEVVSAVRQEKFHMYAIKHINEGIEILTDVPADVVYEAVERRLEKYSRKYKSKKDT
ncbi:ATP-dependent protease [Alkaliphilus metalliredigens QYMF]|uniref:endopeptidase La n=1 Tax=Alkaliphilus metalliredigens (strain QYMF) TaxID=293826 RepID=A6TU89_ALKMQ|nr:ATP-binding protein [Alkaliphilus metalliredigens]ABR49757.1 ATP-dependent protease [Alkaliphilus metalliredigens QYMF]